MELTHDITFSLGDPSGDGHGIYDTYHISCNYSAEEIKEAYAKVIESLNGWDFTNECQDYEDRYVSAKGTQILLNLGFISPEDPCLDEDIDEDGVLYFIDGPDEYVSLYFKLVQLQLKDLEWDYRDLKEEYLSDLDYAGYGLYD